MDPFADASDVEAIWRPLTAAELVVVAARIEEASQQIRDEVPDVDVRIASGALSINTVRFIVRNMVYRLVSPPSFVRQQSVAVDDASKSSTFDASISKGLMFIDPAELARLTGSGTVATSSAYEIAPA